MAVGPVEYLVVAFPGSRFTGAIAPALAEAVASKAVRIIDLTRGPGMNRRGPGLLGAVARTAVVAGTASAVSGRVQRHQRARFAEDDSEQMAEERMRQQTQGQAAQQQPAEPPGDDVISRLERLAELKKQGILTDAEFHAQKARLLAG